MPKGLFPPERYEFAPTLLGSNLTLLLSGSGPFAPDKAFGFEP